MGRRTFVVGFKRDWLAVELLDRTAELVAAASFRTLIPFFAVDVVVESRTFGSFRTVGALAAHGPLRPIMAVDRTAFVALRTSHRAGLDADLATRHGVDDIDVAAFAVKRIAIGAGR